MKTVFSSHSEVCHIFAQRSQTEGRAGNIFFEGDTIYSYGRHYNLATFLNSEAILINDKGYSSSTGKHIGIIRSATSQYKQFYYRGTNLDYVYSTIKNDLLKSLSVARKPELYISQILGLWISLNEFFDYMKVKKKSDPKYKELKRIVNSLNSDSTNYKEKLSNLAKKEAAKKKKEQRENLKHQLQKFYNHEYFNFFNCGDFDYVKISECQKYVETTQNVKIEIQDAKKLYRLIQLKKDIKGYKIGYYTVISINGTLKIGCHNINIDSVHTVGKQLMNL